jgi:hypothetical protein
MQTRPTSTNQNIVVNLNVKDRYDTLTELTTAYPTGSQYAFAVGIPQLNEIYVWNGTQWKSIGNIKGTAGTAGQQGIQGEQGIQGIQGEKGDTGKGLEFNWSGTELGVRLQGASTYTYVNLQGTKGDKGDTGEQGIQGIQGEQGIQGIQGVAGTDGRDIEYIWNGTQLGLRYAGETVYTYVDLKGEKGDPGNGDMSSATYDTDHDGVVERADTADKLTTTRTINGVSFDGSANITVADDTARQGTSLTTTIGNSIQITNTIEAPVYDLSILGETLCKKAVFGTATVRVDGVASLPFTAGASITFSGFATTANNKTVALTSISGLTMTFPVATFTVATETAGTISDGTNIVNIAVSPTNPQVLTSLTSFDYTASGRNLVNKANFIDGQYINPTTGAEANASTLFRSGYEPVIGGATIFLDSKGSSITTGHAFYDKDKIFISGITSEADGAITVPLRAKYFRTSFYKSGWTVDNAMANYGTSAAAFELYQGVTATISLKDTSNNQLENRGIPLTYNTDGSVATWAAQDKVFKDTNGKWKLQGVIEKVIFDGSGDETWAYDSGTARFDVVVPVAGKHVTSSTVNMVCDKFKAIPWANRASLANLQCFPSFSTPNKIFFKYLSYTDVTALKTWLASNPVTVYFELATPETPIELCAADQAALNSIEKTFAGLTNIMLSDSKGQISIQYGWAKGIGKSILSFISTVITHIKDAVAHITAAERTDWNSKEPAITKNTAFNKNYGTTVADVKMNGTQAVGSVDAIARIDHVHPSDESRFPTIGGTITGNITVYKNLPIVALTDTATIKSAHLISYNSTTLLRNYTNESNYTGLQINDYTGVLSNTISVTRMIAGVETSYKLYGEHNVTNGDTAVSGTLANGAIYMEW